MSDDLILEGLKIVLENYEIPRLTKLAIPIWNVMFMNKKFVPEVRSYRAQTKEEAIRKFIHEPKNNGLIEILSGYPIGNKIIEDEFLDMIGLEMYSDSLCSIEPESKKANWLIQKESELVEILIEYPKFKIIQVEDYQSLEIPPFS